MKQIFTLFALTCSALCHWEPAVADAADTLYLRTREKKVVEIKEVYPDQVKYKTANEKGLLTIPVGDIAEIVYNNGIKDVFNAFHAAGKPEIKWLSNISYSDKPEIRLSACVVNEPEKIQIEVNGVPAQVTTRSFKTVKEEGCSGGVRISQQIALKEGKNSIRLIASNKSGAAHSESLSIFRLSSRRFFTASNSASMSSNGATIMRQPRIRTKDCCARGRCTGFRP